MIALGTIVVPKSPNPHEQIVGIVIDPGQDVITVTWFSNQRGVFMCAEAVSDVQISVMPTGPRERGVDNVDQTTIANFLAGI